MPKTKITKKDKKIISYKFGLIAEIVTIIFLSFKGYKILAWRYKTKLGEIDIIASKILNKKSGILVAVEVKARKGEFLAEELVTKHQKMRIKKAITAFTARKNNFYQNFDIRFDLIIIRPWKIPIHFPGFWE